MSSVCLQELSVKSFRCFTKATFSFDAPVVVIEGKNGSGKTSLLEAIHYLCYMRSFRTPSPHDLIHFGNETFFIGARLSDDEITVGATGNTRQVKINQKPIVSYTQLRNTCKVVTVTQEDIDIVKSYPEKRRHFLDHALALHNPESTESMKTFRHTLDSRNAFLARGGSEEEFDIWTEKLWLVSCSIQKMREEFLKKLIEQGEKISSSYFLESHTFSIQYAPKHKILYDTYKQFYASSQKMFEKERFLRRSLFGAHLDDIEIIFNNKPARLYSSRGQQKLLTLFFKISQMSLLISAYGPAIFLIDDFLSDFDNDALLRILKTVLSLDLQLILTTPLSSGPELIALNNLDAPFIKIHI